MNTEYFKSFKKLSPDFFSIEKYFLIVDFLIVFDYNIKCDMR